MLHNETCLCTKKTVEFRSDFEGDVVARIYCPECVDRAPEDAIVFELCEPGIYNGLWAVHYSRGELKRLDPGFRDDDGYYLSLLISGVCAPTIARSYSVGGLCRIFGFKHGADAARSESTLTGAQAALAEADEPTAPLPRQPAKKPAAKAALATKKPKSLPRKK